MSSSAQVKVHVMRHGEVQNPQRIVYGRLPHYHLSELGQQMVRLSAERFAQMQAEGANLVYLAVSPLTRTRESAEPITELTGLQAHPDERVIEAANYFEGLHVNHAELTGNPQHWPKLINPLRPSWGEPYKEQAARMAEAIKDAGAQALALGGSRAEAIIVSHQLPIWMARRSAEGKFLPHDPRTRQCNLASITTFEFADLLSGERPRISYQEPAAPLYSGVIQLPGT